MLTTTTSPLTALAGCLLMTLAAGGHAAAAPPSGGARVVALDKTLPKRAELEIPVGGEAVFETLSVAVRACVVQDGRPAAFVEVSEARGEARTAVYSGWLLAAAPGASTLASPRWELFVSGCAAAASIPRAPLPPRMPDAVREMRERAASTP